MKRLLRISETFLQARWWFSGKYGYPIVPSIGHISTHGTVTVPYDIWAHIITYGTVPYDIWYVPVPAVHLQHRTVLNYSLVIYVTS